MRFPAITDPAAHAKIGGEGRAIAEKPPEETPADEPSAPGAEPDREQSAVYRPAHLKPRDAATLIIIDNVGGAPRILLGRRRPEQIFLPNKFVFPGGRVDAADRSIEPLSNLRQPELSKLMVDMKGSPATPLRARALAMAALRETFEEAGIVIGKPSPEAGTARAISPASATIAFDSPTPVPTATPTLPPSPPHGPDSHAVWKDFLSHGCQPSLSPLTFLARAITPPGRPRRYDTRFFCVEATHIAKTVAERDEELRDLDWFTMDEVRRLDLPNITRAVLEDLSDRLRSGLPGRDDTPVPFYFFKAGSFERAMITACAE